jgi:hypothetical protein
MALRIVENNRLFLDYIFQELQTTMDRIVEIDNAMVEADKSANQSADECVDKSTDDFTDLVIRDVVEHLLSSVCELPAGGDAPPDVALLQDVFDTSCTSGTPAAVDKNGQSDDGKLVEDQCVVLEPAKGPEVKNSLGEIVGWLSLDETPVQPAPRRPRRLAAAWGSVKRFVLGACCIRP